MAVYFGDKYSYEQITEFDKYEVQEEWRGQLTNKLLYTFTGHRIQSQTHT